MRILIDHYDLLLDAGRCIQRLEGLLPMSSDITPIADVIGSAVVVFVMCPPSRAAEVCAILEADGFEL